MGVPHSNISPEQQEKNKEFARQLAQTLVDLFDDGICIRCGADDVECLDNCTEHKCIDCGYVPEQDYSTLKNNVESTGG